MFYENDQGYTIAFSSRITTFGKRKSLHRGGG